MSAHFFLGTASLGSAPIGWWETGKPSYHSIAFFCPRCGEIWGRMVVDGRPWLALARGCTRHPYPHADEPGGSFLPPWPYPVGDLPRDVLRREVELLYEHLERNGELAHERT